MKTLPSNEFWGRRSGSVITIKNKNSDLFFTTVFNQVSWAKAKGGRSTKQSQCRLTNVNKRWFK